MVRVRVLKGRDDGVPVDVRLQLPAGLGVRVSVIDLRRQRASSHRIMAEPDLRIRGPLPPPSASWHVSLCETITAMLRIVGDLSPGDLRIVDAVLRMGSVRAAAKALAPDSPSYRAYIQRRMKQLRERFESR